MLNSEYFTGPFEEQIKQIRGYATVILHIKSGEKYDIAKIIKVESGYLLVEVYPPNGTAAVVDHKSDEVRLTNSTMFAIPYESIAQVEITTEKPRGSGPIGFQGIK